MSTRDNVGGPKGVGQRAPADPESETRGRPPAADDALTERFPGLDPNPGLGSRAALPEGSLPGLYEDAQGDEHRKPPGNAPAPVDPAPTVETTRQDGLKEPGQTDGRRPG